MIQLNSAQMAISLQPEVLAFTQEMFGSPATVDIEPDPEIEGSESLVVRVATCAELREIARLNDVWHRKVFDVAGAAAHHFRLALEVT